MKRSLSVFIFTLLFSTMFFIGCQKSSDVTAPGVDKVNPGPVLIDVQDFVCEVCYDTTTFYNGTGQSQFFVTFTGMTRDNNLVTFSYTFCKAAQYQDLSHWVMDLTELECLLPANYTGFVHTATVQGDTVQVVYGIDPTTQINGFKFDNLNYTAACLDFTITFDESVLETGYIIEEGCIYAGTKAGNDVAFACIPGPICAPDSNGCEWIGETAWSAGPRYTLKGNWATYTPYVSGSTVNLYAGQTMEAGTVTFSAETNGEIDITIVLNSGWRLAEGVFESVKIQGYENAPSGNPSPGLFTTYKGESLTVTVPLYNFYGVHLDVEWEDCE
jgi:hypothetical protein